MAEDKIRRLHRFTPLAGGLLRVAGHGSKPFSPSEPPQGQGEVR
jgi:hypothetical protein